MGVSVNDLALSPGNSTWYTKAWYATVEDHLDYLRDPGNAETVNVEDKDRWRYRNNFYRYLRDGLGLKETELYYVIMRVNQMHSPYEFNENFVFILVPDKGVIERLMDLHLTSKLL